HDLLRRNINCLRNNVTRQEMYRIRLGKLLAFYPPEDVVRRALALPGPDHKCVLEQTVLVRVAVLPPELRARSCRPSDPQLPFHRQIRISQIFRHYKPPAEPRTALRNSSESGV